MMNEASAKRILKRIEQTKSNIVYKRQKAYFKPFFNAQKVWADTAVKYAASFTNEIDRHLKDYQQSCIKAIEKASEKNSKYENIRKANTPKYKTHEYLDPMHNRVIVDDIEDILVTMKDSFELSLKDSYEKYITKGSVRDSAELIYKDYGMEFNFNKFDKSTSGYLNEKTINWSKSVADETEKAIKRELKRGFEDGLGTYEIAENIRQASGFSYSRSESIARTEIISSCNYVSYMAAFDNKNVLGHEWLAANDDRTRPTHSAANGQKRKKGEPFNVGGYKLMYPLDGSLGAPAEEIINCRCTLLDVFEGEGLDSNTIYDENDAGSVEWILRQREEFQNDIAGGVSKRRMLEKGNLRKDEYSLSLEEIIDKRKQSARKNIETEFKDKSNIFIENTADNTGRIIEKGIRNDREYAIIADENTGGKIEGTKVYEGETYSVKIPAKDMRAFVDSGDDNSVLFVHNHPNSTTFSPDDIKLFLKNKKIKSMLLVGHDVEIFRIEKKDFLVRNYTEKQLDKAVEFLQERMDNIYRVYKNTNKLLSEYHNAMNSFARLYGLNYKGSAF